MLDHPIPWLLGALAGIATAAAAILATRLRLLPEVIDLSIIPTGAGFGSLLGTFYGAARRYAPDRIARLCLGGTLFFGGLTAAVVAVALLAEIVS